MAYYSTHSQLVQYAGVLRDCGIDDWDDLQAEAYRVVNRDIELGWYRRQADARDISYTETRFDPAELEDSTPMVALEVFKLIELAGDYMSQHPGTADARDMWQELRDRFATRYGAELESVLALGLDYNWSDSEDDDISPIKARRLSRF